MSPFDRGLPGSSAWAWLTVRISQGSRDRRRIRAAPTMPRWPAIQIRWPVRSKT